MTQTVFSNIVASTKSGTALASDLNSFKDSLLSSHSGTDRPSYAVEGTVWVDQVSASVRDYYLFDGTSDIKLFTYNPTAHTFSFPDDSITGANLGDDVVSAQTTVTIASNDKVLFADASDSNKPKQGLVSDIVTLATAVPVSGSVIQTVNVLDHTRATGSTIIPWDNTIPQSGEGNQYMSLAITPTNALNSLLIRVVANLSLNASGRMTGALFKNDDTSAIAAATCNSDGNSDINQIIVEHYMPAGSTSPITFKFRAGGSIAGTTIFNGNISEQKFGGVINSSITIQEIKA